ncbi:MAG: sensor histidine kinase [Armatimonadota bacterium]
MPDTSFLAYLTASTYWSLVMCWSAILVFYVIEYRRLRTLSPIVATLIIVISIDGLRTLFESSYFGVWYTAKTGLLPYGLFEVLTRPEYVIIPKLMNLLAALIIIGFVVRRWFPDVTELAQRHRDLSTYHAELVEAHAELQRLHKLRDDLVHMIAHDMRLPVTSIIGSLRTALDEPAGSPVKREMIENSMHDAQRLAAMTADLLDINRMEAGQLRLDLEPVPLAAAMSGAAADVRWAADEKGVELTVKAGADDPVVLADAAILRRVLANLLQNAIRHTDRGGTVTVCARPVEVEGRAMGQLSVADTGEGIPEQIRYRIFDRFFHAAGRSNGTVASMGLGLAFCKLAVEAHGGAIWVESEVGVGTTFFFTLPLAS